MSVDSAAAVYIGKEDSVQTQGVLSTLNRYTQCLQYMRTPKAAERFLVQPWVESDAEGFIFINNNRNQKDALRGVFTLFINQLANAVLSLPEDIRRRRFLILDELGTLHRLESLKDMFVLGRSRGLSIYAGFQEMAQIEEVYGVKGAKSILNQCNSKFMFRVNDHETAGNLADILSKRKTRELESSYSTGSDDRDSESYREKEEENYLVTPGEILDLPNLNCYVKMPGMPVTRTALKYKDYGVKEEGFIPNPMFLAKKKDGMSLVQDVDLLGESIIVDGS